MKTVLICVKNTTIALKMRKNARNNKIDLITKVVIMKSFIYFCESRMKRAMTRKTTKIITIMKRKNTLQRIVSNSSKIIFKSTLWKIFDKALNKASRKRFHHKLSLKFWTIRKIKWTRDDCRRNCESQKKILKCICWITCSNKKQMKEENDHIKWRNLNQLYERIVNINVMPQ